ncbi:MAG: hypothetical protein AAFR46_19085 [Pseudomonadota bacterium]
MAYHMFFGFCLRERVAAGEVAEALQRLGARLIACDLMLAITPMARRDRHPVLDTEPENPRAFFATMVFRDRAQADAAVAHFEARDPVTAPLHAAVIRRITEASFLCYQEDG